MKTLLSLPIYLTMLLGLIASNSISQSSGTINFDNSANWIAGSGLLTAYESDHQYVEQNWLFTGGPALRQTTTVQDGFPGALGTFSWRLNSPAGTEFYMISQSEGQVEQFSFAVRRWDASPSPNFVVEYSNNGGVSYNPTGTTINNAFLNNSSAFNTFNFVVPAPVNTLPGQFIVRVRRVSTSERIIIDDFGYTIGAPAPGSLASLRTPDCSRVLTTMNQMVYARIIGADSYAFEVTNLENGLVNMVNKTTRDFNLTEIPNPVFNVNYQIRVQAVVGGVPQPVGTPCVITSPTSPSQLRSVDCGKQLISFAHLSYCNITDASQWEFEATNLSTMAVETVIKQDRSFALNDLSNPQNDVSYGIRVRVVQNGIQQPYGASCEIFAPVTGQQNAPVVNPLEFEGLTETELIAFKASVGIVDNYTNVEYFPNPFSSEGFAILMEGDLNTDDIVSITIFDMTGKAVYTQDGRWEEIANTRFGSELENGIYSVIVRNNAQMFTNKLIRK